MMAQDRSKMVSAKMETCHIGRILQQQQQQQQAAAMAWQIRLSVCLSVVCDVCAASGICTIL